jgi:hypothetical protein
MSERPTDPRGTSAPATGLPANTGEFRATPDISASTAQFRAFAAGQEGDAEHAWSMRAPGRNIAALAGIIVVVAVVLVVLAFLVLGH